MAIGASEVARRHGRGDITIIGIDAAPNIGIKAVADSVIDATFLYPTEGHRLIQTALKILKGKPYEREVIICSEENLQQALHPLYSSLPPRLQANVHPPWQIP